MTIEPKYYFVYYNCKRYGWKHQGGVTGGWVSTGCSDSNNQDITDKHPLQWQIDCNKEYDKEIEEHGYKKREYYEVISWQRLTLEEYKKFKGKIG
jgi:hypothetical protein